ncbi:bifunctional UDP-N-acetylglucosamine diphosphorylase/glucosamine-1-phosphate N-acetyltransferase GlmU [Fimbriimonas ginsengisoli]|uniref:Bifunctional protein GlmU n=1 Tax=Fimbriimonas ginsengisoli Gsoil 348 TaxID=661478 RepID=A0A068NXA6_FIMGI|nr:bifunctional UDP-N-acetylglucosamine diphosphorylase/glucosamine-1-phosphate N-acetyltransferase GlmU [Fimbriimonas ginsengisoli]AIE88041.1 bifunctional N-acetylglucosamine-1-phosphate uridyltransferase / glucosamine-1-phosphate N-acetyltransferase [Fimbriimonas ginsengisoli Gsoil 348]
MQSSSVAGIILAAGKGTRMKSDLPKGLHRVCGLPMVEHVGRAIRASGVSRPIVVIGHGGEAMKAELGDGYDYVWQREQLGTGHAALMASEALAGYEGPVIVASGDTPMLQADTFDELIKAHQTAGAVATLATSLVDNPHGYGRIVRGDEGEFLKIVEQKDTNDEQNALREVNAALYIFDSKTLFRILPTLKNSNAQGEYYLTDVLETVVAEGGKVVAKIFDNPDILAGVNDRWQLAQLDREMRLRVIKQHAINGVTFLDLDSVSIGVDVTIGLDTVIEPQTILVGNTSIGAGCRIGPFTRIEDSRIGDKSSIVASYLDTAVVGSSVWVGPWAHLRPKSNIGDGTKIGNFVEIKNATLAPGAKVNHLSYVGDATVGARSNIGAGTITCNYDGFSKSQTIIGADAFVGSNSTLVAPVSIGNGAFVAAGSVITNEVPADAMAFGRARQENKEGRAAQWRKLKSELKQGK